MQDLMPAWNIEPVFLHTCVFLVSRGLDGQIMGGDQGDHGQIVLAHPFKLLGVLDSRNLCTIFVRPITVPSSLWKHAEFLLERVLSLSGLIDNIAERRSDACKLVLRHCCAKAGGVGLWFPIHPTRHVTVISVMVMTNLAIIGFTTRPLETYFVVLGGRRIV